MKRLNVAVLAFVAALVLLPTSAAAGVAVPTEKDPVAAARAVRLAEKLRCLVCQNQTIADSSATLAQDLRKQIAEQIAAGKTDDQILDYMVARYGDFVLLRPRLTVETLLLWFTPFALLLAGLIFAIRAGLRRKTASAEEAGLSEDERRRAEGLAAGLER